MVSSRTSVCAEQTPHPSSGTSSSRPENWHPIGLDSGSPYHLYLGESAHPVLHWSLHNSLKNSTDEPDETEGNAFSLTCVNQFGGNSPLTHQPPSDTGNFKEVKVVAKEICNDGLKGQPGREFNRIQCLYKVLHETEFDVEGWKQYLARFSQRVG